MTHDTYLQWLGGKPPGPQSAQAGSCWRFTLPLADTGSLPVCHYTSELFKHCAPDPKAGPLELILNLPPDIEAGIYSVMYSVDVQPTINGQFLLKILPAKPVNEKPDMLQTDPEPCQSAKPKTNKGPQIGKPDPRAYGLQKVYRITVRRDNVPIPKLHRPIEKHKSLLVGKVSASKGILPDIDLTAHFATRDDAHQCSRSQAKVYCMGARIVIENLGKREINGPDGQVLKTGDSHSDWQPGQRFCLPGGINLTLEEVI
jgi:hypothetical protein